MNLTLEESSLMLFTVNNFGHQIGLNTIKPYQFKSAGILENPSSLKKSELMRFLGSMNFFSNFAAKLHVNLKPHYDLLYGNVKFYWIIELESLIQQIRTNITKDDALYKTNTNYPRFITVDSSLVSTGCFIFQIINIGKPDSSHKFLVNLQKRHIEKEDIPNLDEPLTLSSLVSHRIFKPVQFFDKLKPNLSGPFKFIRKPTEVTYELLTRNGKTFHTHRNH